MNEGNHAPVRLLMLIATPRLAGKAVAMFDEGRVPVQYRLDGHGTASREVLDMLGLDSGDKSILLSILPKPFADDMLDKLRRTLRLGSPGSGVACTIPLTGGNSRVVQMLDAINEERGRAPQRRNAAVEENAYQLVIAVINQGYSGEVMAAARPAGATGGTVLHSRRVGAEETLAFWGISVQAEKEIVTILCRKEEKNRRDAGRRRGMRHAQRGAGHRARRAGGSRRGAGVIRQNSGSRKSSGSRRFCIQAKRVIASVPATISSRPTAARRVRRSPKTTREKAMETRMLSLSIGTTTLTTPVWMA